MSAIGEAVLSRDPAAPDYPIEHYEIRHQDFDALIRSLDEYFPSMRRQLPGKKVLDIGCSQGMESIALAQPGATETVGIDMRIGLDEANALRERLCPRCQITFAEMDATRLAFPEESFEAVVTCSSMEHFQGLLKVLQECKQILRPGGRTYVKFEVWSGRGGPTGRTSPSCPGYSGRGRGKRLRVRRSGVDEASLVRKGTAVTHFGQRPGIPPDM